MLNPINPAAEPVVFEHNGRVCARSQDIAAYFGREHASLVRSLERVLKQATTDG
jgi:phage regulator Rha-like protein